MEQKQQHESKSGLTRLRILFATTTALGIVACGGGGGGSTETPAPPAVNIGTVSTGTTAYGVLGTSTARIAFVAGPTGVLPVLIEGSGSLSAGSRERPQADPLPNVSPVTFSFPVSACTVDSNDLKGICIGYGSPKIGVMDLSTFATSLKVSDIAVQEFDSTAGNVPNSYSGGSCILCGVAADVGKHRFVVGGSGGFRVFAYGATTATVVHDIPVGENFAFLPQPAGTSYIIAPEYEPLGGQRRLNVIDMEAGKVYAWTKHTDNATELGAESGSFISSEVDAASVDIVTGMIALSTESSADFMLVDFGQAVFNATAGTFEAPHTFALSGGGNALGRLTDVATSTSGSILLSHGEGAANLGVTQLPLAKGAGGAFPTGVGPLGVFNLNDASLDRTPCGASYFFSGKLDPHGLGLFAGLDKGQRGLIVDASNTCAALLDLAGLLAAPRSSVAPSQIDMSILTTQALVKFVKIQ